jgi:hypothetical protein
MIDGCLEAAPTTATYDQVDNGQHDDEHEHGVNRYSQNNGDRSDYQRDQYVEDHFLFPPQV